MLKAAILGCGGIANAHAKILSGLESRVSISALCDIDSKRADHFNVEYAGGKASIHTDYTEMFSQADIDVVYICLPPFAHSNEVELAAERGIHIFIEKPIALKMDLANRMVQAVESHGVRSQVGFMFRFGDAVCQVKEMLDSGEAGAAGLMTGKYMCNSLHTPWWRAKEKSGGQIVEQIIHTFDILRYLLGNVKSVYATMDNLFHGDVPDYTVEDVSATIITFTCGAIATVTGTNGGIPGKWLSSYDLVAKNITVQFENENKARVYRTDRTPVVEDAISGSTNVFLAESLDFLDAVEHDMNTRTPMIEGAKTLELVLAADESARSGKVIELPQ